MKEKTKKALTHDIELIGKRVPVLAVAVLFLIAAGSAAVLNNFGQHQGEIKVDEALVAEPLSNLEEEEDGVFTETIQTTAGADETVTTMMSLESQASVTTPYNALVTYDEEAVDDELDTSLVKTDLEIIGKETGDDLSASFVNADSDDESVDFRVSGDTEDAVGAWLHAPYQAEDVEELEQINYKVETGSSHTQSEFDWAAWEIYVEEDTEVDFQEEELEAGTYYVRDTNSNEGGVYEFGGEREDVDDGEVYNTLTLLEEDFETSVTQQDSSSDVTEDFFEEGHDAYTVEAIRVGTGSASGDEVEATYNSLQVQDEDLLDSLVESVYEQEEGEIDESLEIGINGEHNLATVTEVGNHAEKFDVTTDLSPID